VLQVGEEQHVAIVSKHLTFVHTYDSIVDPFILVNVDMNRSSVVILNYEHGRLVSERCPAIYLN